MSGKQDAPLSVSVAVSTAKASVNGLGTFSVAGEVSGFRGPNARSGHCYFAVKDESSSMDVIVWRNTFARLDFALKDGLSVVLRGKFDVYVGTGRLSFIASSIALEGEGLLRQQVAALARKLESEGLMDAARKRPIPRFCTRVAVVTSLSGSVIEDVKRTLRRRNPLVALDVVGCAVQGPGAPATIIRALQTAAAAAPEAVLLVRGGGSFEDLMTFNDEALARAVASCPVPVITGIGHEPDTSICDMVSDRRASTPTAAAESVAPAIDDIVNVIEMRRHRLGVALQGIANDNANVVGGYADRSRQAMEARLARESALLDAMARRRCLENPLGFVEERDEHLMQTEQRLHDAMPRTLQRDASTTQLLAQHLSTAAPRTLQRERQSFMQEARRLSTAGEGLLRPHEASMARMAATLEALSPLKVLSRGYAITRDEDGCVISDTSMVAVGQSISVVLNKGSLSAKVTEVNE